MRFPRSIAVVLSLAGVLLTAVHARSQEGICAPPSKGSSGDGGPGSCGTAGSKPAGSRGLDLSGNRASIAKKGQAAKGVKPARPSADLKWVNLSGGSFEMGSKSGDQDELPVHKVTVSAFLIAATEVTVAQYRACVAAGACTEPRSGGDCNWGKAGRDSHPVNCVDYRQASAFCGWVGGRLPTEAEWEYAATAGKGTPASSGMVMSVEDFKSKSGAAGVKSADLENVAWYDANSGGATHPVGQKKHNEFKLYDMLGNVMEWVSDWWGLYPVAEIRDPSGPTEGHVRIVRGGAWGSAARRIRAADREQSGPDTAAPYIGFRPVRPLPGR